MSTSRDAELQLPPSFSLVTLREIGDATAHAAKIAADKGAGTLVWARRFDLAEFAIVLEPDEPLRLARRALYAGANALGDTLTFQAPPERPITFDWPDAVRVDGALVGGVRLVWPEGSEDEVPDWVVFGATIRTAVMRAGESGLRPLLGGLDEEGFEGISPAAVIDGWTRYFLREMDRWNEYGFDGARERWLERTAGTAFAILDNGDFLDDTGKRSLAAELRTPSWLDPATGAPWI